MNGKKDNGWKIIIKNEDDLVTKRHKSGKVYKIFSGVLFFAILVVILIGGDKIFSKYSNDFEGYLKNEKYEEAKKCYDYNSCFDILTEEIINRKQRYDKKNDKESFTRMWELIHAFEDVIRVSDKAFYKDLMYFPKEKQIVKMGYLSEAKESMQYLEWYYNEDIVEKFYDGNKLYDYYVQVELVEVKSLQSISEEVDILALNYGYKLCNEENKYAKEIFDILEERRAEETEYELYY